VAWWRGGVRGFLRSWEEQLDRKAAFQRVWSFASCRGSHEPSSSAYSGREPALRLSPGEALTLVLLFSLGLWVLIWAAVSLLAVYGLR
jgi:hypothetical protein